MIQTMDHTCVRMTYSLDVVRVGSLKVHSVNQRIQDIALSFVSESLTHSGSFGPEMYYPPLTKEKSGTQRTAMPKLVVLLYSLKKIMMYVENGTPV